MPKHTHASAHVSARNKAPPPLPVTPKKPKGRTANDEHSPSRSVGLPNTPVSQPRSNGKRSRKNDEVTIILSEAVSVKVRKGRKNVIIKEESKDDEVYNKPLAIEEAEEIDNNDTVSDVSVTYHCDPDQRYGGKFEEEEEEDDEEDEMDTNIDWPSSDKNKDHDISSISGVKKVEDNVINQKDKPKGKSYVTNKKQILLAPPGTKWFMGELCDEAMAEYLKKPPNKCAVMSGLIELLNPSHKQLLMGYMTVKWAKPISWMSDIELRTWDYTDFIDSVPKEWLNDFLQHPIHGRLLVNLGHWPSAPRYWKTRSNGTVFSSGDGSGVASYLVENEYDGRAIMCLTLGGVGSCRLIQHSTIEYKGESKIIRQIGIHPMSGELELFVRSAADIFNLQSVRLNVFKNTLIVGTKSVKKLKGDNPVDSSSSKGCFASSNWSLSKNGSNVSAPKSNFALLGSIEVPIYHSMALDID
ncbi:hypothetical protein M422DRAFT_261858 [Sphaerobolus stellatus SS14]|uniref:Uncharacterized protein n=1 Tax=Sphaerobolus stellatus (strain SS14) TaxID=990650 RepID=A0A0C9V2P0_SPHS4|nr:hypothetical protein M422DRAFT_261858 [Sphaerobolus stellatus SS14]